jgi:hypothetical protein
VTHEGTRVTVAFDVPAGFEDEWAGQLTLLVNQPDGPPEPRLYDVTTPGVQQPG